MNIVRKSDFASVINEALVPYVEQGEVEYDVSDDDGGDLCTVKMYPDDSARKKATEAVIEALIRHGLVTGD